MKSETTKAEKLKMAREPGPTAPTGPRPVRTDVAVGDISPDAGNRRIDEGDEDFLTLTDSVRVMGVLVAAHVQLRGDGKYHLCDGERRWRAAQKAGLATIPCDVWPETASGRDIVLAAVAMNEHRKAHTCLSVARRLRQVKNEYGESQEQLAGRLGMPLTRVKWYLSLFAASDALLTFFDTEEVPLKNAVELVRYEKSSGEVAVRALLQKHRDSPLTWREIQIMRKRSDGERDGAGGTAETSSDRSTPPKRAGLAIRIVAAFRRDPQGARIELEEAMSQLGLKIVGAEAVAQGN